MFVIGESYAGVYVPTLALQILTNEPSFNLKGIMVGNGVVGDSGQDHNRLAVDYLHGNGLYSSDLYAQIYKVCGGNMRNPSTQCQNLLNYMGGVVGHVNIYGMLYIPSMTFIAIIIN
jgi:serine carboxypeptidase-like clade 1